MLKDLTEEKIDDVLLVTINISSATLDNAQKFKDFLLRRIEKGENRILIDCSQIIYMDSTFLGSLVFALKKLAAGGGNLKLIISNISSPVWTMFETTRMSKVFEMFQDKDSAIESF